MSKRRVTFLKIFLFTACYNIAVASQHSFYVGVQAGVSTFSGKQQAQATNDFPNTIVLIKDKNIKSKGLAGGLYAAYVLRICDFGIGAEGLWQYTNMEKNLEASFRDAANGDDLHFSLKTSLRSRAELLLKPGYFIKDYFTYAILGIAFQSTVLEYTAIGRQNGAANPVRTNSDKTSKTVRGNTFGLGVQKNIYEHVDMGLEFKATKLSARNYEFNVPGVSQIALSNSLKNISTYSCCLRFMYKF